MNTCTPAPPKDEAAIKNGLIGKLCNKCINTMVKIENPRKKSITSNLCSIIVTYLIQLFNSSGEANQTNHIIQILYIWYNKHMSGYGSNIRSFRKQEKDL